MSFVDRLNALKASNKEKYSCYEVSDTHQSDGDEEAVFVNLAPTSKADEKGTYCRALEFATKDEGIRNIALTGPYGSGKSSIIQTFLTNYKGSELQVSLAAFVPEKSESDPSSDDDSSKSPTAIDKKNIERSILQQMLYGADANKLPLSRFNRIQSPTRWAPLISLVGLVGTFATAYLLSKTGDLFDGKLLTPFEVAKWFNYLMLAFSGAFLWFVAHKVYLQTFGISLKSISLKNIELASSVTDESSILNKHLDEIIYFFQSTDYDLVIFEDLDRFNDPSIFVTLREINNLVNENAGVKRKIRFLYALRDDIFANTERTKFFEFIVPVIPVINHSNSIDKVLEQTDRQALTNKLDTQFLSEVSRYLNDMRLIKSIFNEYAIYSASLADENGSVHNPNKLLAILIYKNVFPRDFEALHQQQGTLAEVLAEYDKSVLLIETNYKNQIQELENKLKASNEQLPNSVKELTSIYVMAILELCTNGYYRISFDGVDTTARNLSTHDSFETLLLSRQVIARNENGYSQRLDISKLQEKIDPHNTYLERKTKIEQKATAEQELLYSKIRGLKEEAASVNRQKFHQVIQANESHVSEIISKLGNGVALLKYLIFEGYLDDTYYQYISFFHEGRMSPKDNEFLINIRGYKTPSPEFNIDNPDEVVRQMRDTDFSRSYILNHNLMDFIVENNEKFSAFLQSALKYISENFDHCDDFFTGYYLNGKQTHKFVEILSEQWSGFALAALDSSARADHIARILVSVPSRRIEGTLNKNKMVTKFLSTSGKLVFDQGLSFDLNKLTALDIKVAQLSEILKHTELVDHLIENNLYAISPENIDFIVSKASTQKSEHLATRNLTTIFESGNKELVSYIKDSYDEYLENVFFSIDTNTHESVSTLLELLLEDSVDTEVKVRILEFQKTIFPSFEHVPVDFYTILLSQQTIAPSWDNLVQYRNFEDFDGSSLTRFLKKPEVLKSLKSSNISSSDEAAELRRFIFNNDSFEDEEYRSYIELLPKAFKTFPERVSDEKILILIKAGKVVFNENSFASLRTSSDLLVAFLIVNISKYIASSEVYVLDDGIRASLISSGISNEHKFKILGDLSANSVIENSDLARNIAEVLAVSNFNPEDFSFDYLKSVITNAEMIEVKIDLLNRCHIGWDKGQVESIIQHLPEPFSNIAKLGLAPKIPASSENITLAGWLEEEKYISSQTVKGGKVHINNYKKKEEPKTTEL